MMTPRFYAGIGSRETPPAILETMRAAARRLRDLGFVLRSGGAAGADTAFAEGAGVCSEIFLPWPGFRGIDTPFPEPTRAAFEMAGLSPVLLASVLSLLQSSHAAVFLSFAAYSGSTSIRWV